MLVAVGVAVMTPEPLAVQAVRVAVDQDQQEQILRVIRVQLILAAAQQVVMPTQ